MRRGDQRWNERVAAHRRNLPLDGYTLHYLDTERGAPLLLIHGYTDSSYTWHLNLDAFTAAGFRALAVDLPGLGQSTIPGAGLRLGAERLAEELIRLLDRLELERVSVVGHSMGGGLALYLCACWPDRVARAVAIAPVSRRPRQPLALARPGAHLAASVAGRWVFWHGLRSAFADRSLVSDAMIDEYARPAAKPGYWKLVARLSREYFSDAFEGLRARLPQIAAPTLLLWGSRDTWVKPRPALAEQIPGARCEILEGAGHNVHQERPDLVNRLIADFLR